MENKISIAQRSYGKLLKMELHSLMAQHAILGMIQFVPNNKTSLLQHKTGIMRKLVSLVTTTNYGVLPKKSLHLIGSQSILITFSQRNVLMMQLVEIQT